MSHVPYGDTLTVDATGENFSCLDTGSHPATWVNVKNRDDSARSFDISYDAGTTFITRLQPGMALSIGGNIVQIRVSSIQLKCVEAGSGSATAEITCISGAS